MKKVIALLSSLSIIMLGGVMLSGGASATGNHNAEPCYTTETVVDQEAYDEKVIDQEATPGSPEVAEVSHTVHHEAVTEVKHHEAVTHTEYHFAKFTRERTNKNNKGWSEYGSWSKWSPETHTSWEQGTGAIGSPQFHSSGKNGNTKWERQWQAMHDGQTRTITDKAAWDETVTVEEAYDEKVIDTEYKPAVPATEEVSHTVHHEATYKDIQVKTECPKPTKVTVAASITDATCDTPGTITLVGEHVTFVTVSDFGTSASIPAGTYNATIDGTLEGAPTYTKVKVIATADEGYKIKGKKKFSFEFTDPGDCEVVVPPVEPPVVTPPVVEPPVVAPPVDTPAVVTPVKAPQKKVVEEAAFLPATGAPENLIILIVIAGLFMTVGGAILWRKDHRLNN